MNIYFIAMFAFLACLEGMIFTLRYTQHRCEEYSTYYVWSPLFFGVLYYVFAVLIAAGVV